MEWTEHALSKAEDLKTTDNDLEELLNGVKTRRYYHGDTQFNVYCHHVNYIHIYTYCIRFKYVDDRILILDIYKYTYNDKPRIQWVHRLMKSNSKVL